MYILGINAYHGDSSACLIKDGKVIAAIEEERLNRVKHWAGLPFESINFCLNKAQISIEELDHIAISRNPKANLLTKIVYVIRRNNILPTMRNRILNAFKVSKIKDVIAESFSLKSSDIKAELHHVEHHLSHIASSFFTSGFQEAALLSVDGFGDFTSTMTAIGKGNNIKQIDKVKYPHSLGVFYTSFTQLLGFTNYGDEYKVMGLSAYGEPKYIDKLKKVLVLNSDGTFKLNSQFFNHFTKCINMTWQNGSPSIGRLYTDELTKLFGTARQVDEPITQYHKDIASSVQKYCEDTLFHLLNELHNKTGLKNLCVSGGVGQNSLLNGKILRKTGFEKTYFPSACHDAGTSLGAAFYVYNQKLKKPRCSQIQHSYWGASYDRKQIEEILQNRNIKYTCFNDIELYDRVTESLSNNGVVGWFQGASEFGPRALGNRSILADPRNCKAKDMINRKIKFRERFRPFAPSILKDHMSDYFEQTDDVPFMEKVYKIKDDKQMQVPAISHIDGTGRVQTVTIQNNKRYHELITCFYEKTGTPMLLNTSFNENEPIVNSPDEAIDCFIRTDMDMLVLGNIIIEK